MPIQNGNVSYNIGRDCQLVIQGPRGRIDLPNVMGFDCKQGTVKIEKTLLNGQPMNAMLPRVWNGSFEIERGSSGLDDEISVSENQFRQNGIVSNYTIYQYVTEGNGNQSTYQFDGTMIEIDAGSWKGDASVTQKIMFTANTRRKVS